MRYIAKNIEIKHDWQVELLLTQLQNHAITSHSCILTELAVKLNTSLHKLSKCLTFQDAGEVLRNGSAICYRCLL